VEALPGHGVTLYGRILLCELCSTPLNTHTDHTLVNTSSKQSPHAEWEMCEPWAGGGVSTRRGILPLQEKLPEVSTFWAYNEMMRQVVTQSGTRVREVWYSSRLQVKTIILLIFFVFIILINININ